MGMITVEPMGGLANRLRFIASAAWLKTQTKKELIVIWNQNYELHCPYEKLFSPHPAFQIRTKKKADRWIRSAEQASGWKKNRINLINRLNGIDFCLEEADFESLVWSGKLDIMDRVLKSRNCYIRSCQEFGDNRSALHAFQPVPKLSEKINSIIVGYRENTIGVHIRRTDHEKSVLQSPLSGFIEKMKEEVRQDESTIFFLSTDDLTEQEVLQKEFGDRIMVYKKEINRQSITGMEDAVVDFYCLSKTKKIIGSYWSSFSETAAKINNVPLHTVKI